MTRTGLSRALVACLGLGAADVAALNLVVLPGLRTQATAPRTAPPAAPAPVVAAKTTMPPPAPPPPPAPVVAEPVPEPVEIAQPRDAAAIVEFDKDSHRVGLRSSWTLHKLVARLPGDAELVLIGHADSTGSPEINDRLSLERAEAVARRLAELGVARARLRVEARGDREPRGAGNDRRVEIFTGGTP